MSTVERVCGYCRASFGDDAALRQHIDRAHDNGGFPRNAEEMAQRSPLVAAVESLMTGIPADHSPYQRGKQAFADGKQAPGFPPADASWEVRLFHRGYMDAAALESAAKGKGAGDA